MTPPAQSVSKNTTWLTLAFIFQKVFAFIYFTIIARFIGASDIGTYTFAISLTTIFAIFIDFGLSSVLTREVAKDKDKAEEYVNNIIGVKLILAAVIYAVIVIVINILSKPTLTQTMVYLAGLVMVIDSFTLVFWAVFRAFQNLKYEAINLGINQLIILVIGLAGVYLKFPLYILIVALLCGTLFSFFYSLILLKVKLKFKFKLNYNRLILKNLFKIALPFALAGIFIRVYSYIDQILLSVLVGDQALGWYSVPYKITYAFQFIPAALSAALYPAMSNFFVFDKTRLKNLFEQSMFVLILLSIPASVGIACLADKIILTLYTAEFAPSILTLQIFIFALIPVFLSFPIGAILNSCDRQTINTINVGIIMVVNLVLNLILIPIYQYVGAAIVALITQLLLVVLNLFWVPKIISYDAKFLLVKFAKSSLSALLMAVVILLLKPHLNFIFLIIIGGLIYLIAIYILKGVTKDNLVYFWQSIFKKAVPPAETENLGT